MGFVFQACVLMVQLLWKPMNDDPALFYVIPAVWGVCNAIWEVLIFCKYPLKSTIIHTYMLTFDNAKVISRYVKHDRILYFWK